MPPLVMTEVRKFVNGSNSESERLFSDKFSHKKWGRICKDASAL